MVARVMVLSVLVATGLAGTAGAAPRSSTTAGFTPARSPAVRPATTYAVSVDAAPGDAVNHYSPLRALGAGVDAQNNGAVKQIYTPANVKEMLSSGVGAVTYRLYTELGVQDWHWNPVGSWSQSGNQGYWVGAPAGSSPQITDSYGYRLPHRGDTRDQANNDDYGRLDDGDPTTYWKSDPYLDATFTGESNTLHPQWALVDLGAKKGVDGVSITWSNPYATSYAVQYWTGDSPINDPANGNWVTFPSGTVTNGTGGTVTLMVDSSPRSVRYVRFLMTVSSNTCDSHGSGDPRDCVGFAIDELGVGTVSGSKFTDFVKHAPNKSQSRTYASSTDPWHASTDRVTDEEQAGLDTVYTSGVTRGLPAIMPVSMLYGTPDDAAAELQYLEARGYPIAYVEMGEEPDGQYIVPEDYGALYIQWATAVHAIDPRLQLGGPVFQGTTGDVQTWPDQHGNVSWMQRFLAYLSSHGHLTDLAFMSFEWYPFSPCGSAFPERELISQPGLASGVIQTWFKDGLPGGTPILITETNYSANTTEHFQDIVGALWYADAAGAFLASGAAGFYLYEYEPDPLFDYSGCKQGWGSWGMWNATPHYTVKQPTSQYFAAQLLTQQWSDPVDASHTVYPATTNVLSGGKPVVSAYAVQRPDGAWSVLLVNKDPSNAYGVSVTFANGSTNEYFSSPVAEFTLGPAQYVWHPNGKNGTANPDGPYATSSQPGGAGAVYTLPASSVTVLRAGIAASSRKRSR
jgi:hypothetical protein